jgi:antitoxin VapB
MRTAHTKIFMSNKSQAVRLPKAVALPEHLQEVDIVAIGNKRIITPSGESWDDWFDGSGVTEDFMLSRDQPKDQQREPI